MGWRLLKRAAETSGRTIIPVDSEHSALFQLTSGVDRMHIDSLIITASGGAFRDLPIHRLGDVTPEQASTHPNWNMGRKITIDSASMANKGLEIIEAVRMFDFSPGKVSVLVHPESLVHAMVRTIDGCLYAQISAPDMRSPIQNALDWPDLHPAPYGTLDLAGRSLTFRAPDQERYPLLGLAYEAVRAGEGASVAYNAADEVAVAAFEAGKIRFTQIAGVVAATLQADWPSQLDDEGSIFETDSRARHAAKRSVLEIQCS